MAKKTEIKTPQALKALGFSVKEIKVKDELVKVAVKDDANAELTKLGFTTAEMTVNGEKVIVAVPID